MHELAVTEEILRLAEQIAEEEQAIKVTDIYLEIGKLSGIIDESVTFYWDSLCKGTVCEEAVLHFNAIPTRMRCSDCGKEYVLEHDLVPCPTCKSMNIKIISGEEFTLHSVEIEK
ncbi:MAG TPA: hydrogenase maturation nickel metallochaperone HypA [Anaerolineaceae bacterium]|uniref:Hydrogenase maturation factor HypA n=1 Tax=Anaerolinea thermophila TaxID=167964 RepID=A0A101FZB0_9CHLR|nr:MAG: putative hydrogenase nickel incorporation protein HypA [Anaerolinea thermophila]HAF60820.1 hydrogenase maturation nickel metallochaperone HypA [Anaerolineaceae bacterium]